MVRNIAPELHLVVVLLLLVFYVGFVSYCGQLGLALRFVSWCSAWSRLPVVRGPVVIHAVWFLGLWSCLLLDFVSYG